MRHSGFVTSLLFFLLVSIVRPLGAAGLWNHKYIDFDGPTWTFSGQGTYTGRQDRRALYVISHPWEPGVSGNYGQAEVTATIPTDWKPPYALHFYVSDNYIGNSQFAVDPGWRGLELYQGHRFKQVLIDSEVVWESDMTDDIHGRYAVDVTRWVKPGRSFRLVVRVIDKVGTDSVLPGDAVTAGDYDKALDLSSRRFMTNVWWGDIAFREQDNGAKQMPPRPRPAESVVARRHQERWPMAPLQSTYKKPIDLPLESVDELPANGFPVTCGIPLPYGKVKDLGRISIQYPNGKTVPAQLETLNTWQDGSLRWVLFDFIAKPGNSPYRLVLNPKARPIRTRGIKIKQVGNRVRLDTGAQIIELGENPDLLIDRISSGSGSYLTGNISGRTVVLQDDKPVTYHPRWDSVRVTSNGPVRATVELRGQLVGPGEPLGRFVLRLNAYAGQPMLRMYYRVFNDTGHKLKIRDLSLSVPYNLTDRATIAWDDRDKTRKEITAHKAELVQSRSDSYDVNADSAKLESGKQASGWMSVQDGDCTMMVALRGFWQQFPKALRVDGKSLEIGLFSPPGEDSKFEQWPGEAKRHEIVLYFGGKDSAENISRLARNSIRPPRLFSADWFCASGALGAAYPHTDPAFDGIAQFIKNACRDVSPELLQFGSGIRDYGDMRYSLEPSRTCWSNNYYDAMKGYFGEYLISGDGRWFDRGEDSATHVMDIDQNHHDIVKPEDVGGVHDCYSGDHAGDGGGYWTAIQRQCAGFAAYYRLTGDPDAKEALVMLADCLIRNKRHVGSTSCRDHTGALYSLVWAYDETGDPKYLKACRSTVEDLLNGTVIVPRRGTYAELHANWNYMGGLPWFQAQLIDPLYLYYRLSGDVDAAQLAVGLAEALIEESMTPGKKGDFFGYSFSPRFIHSTYTRPSDYNVLLAPALLCAWDLTEDREFLDCARGAYEETVEKNTVSWITNCYWNVPTMTYFLHEAEQN